MGVLMKRTVAASGLLEIACDNGQAIKVAPARMGSYRVRGPQCLGRRAQAGAP
jgi:hypothetical protein